MSGYNDSSSLSHSFEDLGFKFFLLFDLSFYLEVKDFRFNFLADLDWLLTSLIFILVFCWTILALCRNLSDFFSLEDPFFDFFLDLGF